MIWNYFKVAFRTLLRSRGYATVNVLGLAIGIAGATMLMMYVSQELSFDKLHDDSDKTYRLLTTVRESDTRLIGANFPQMGRVLTEEFPEVSETLTLYRTRGQINFRLGEQRITEESWLMADANFFSFFDFELIAGDAATVLSKPKSIVLSKTLARKYFGDAEPVGQLIEEFDWGQLVVTGVFKDVPENSHLQFDLIIDSKVRGDAEWIEFLNGWEELSGYTYVKVDGATTLANLQAGMPALEEKYLGTEASKYDVSFQNLEDIHFGSAAVGLGLDRNIKGDKNYLIIFSAIATFLLIIAAVNYANLATSKALNRAKEVGVRKVVGARKGQLVMQFLSESVLITFIALVISIGLIDLALPYFNEITGRSFSIELNNIGDFLPVILGVTFAVGLLSGIYPAFFVTRFQPAQILKGVNVKGSKSKVKRTLVVLQFGLSIVMIIATLVVSDQMRYLKGSDPGFQTEGVLVIDINSFYTRRDFKQMKEAFANIPGVKAAATASRVPGEWKQITEIDLSTRAGEVTELPLKSFYMGFDADTREVFDFDIVQGDYFSGDDANDSTKVLLNRAAVAAMGLESPVGSLVHLYRTENRTLDAQVIGVVDDFNYQSFHSAVAPLVIGSWNSGIRSIDYFTLKVETAGISNLVEEVTKVHNEFDPATTIEYNFLDEQLAIKYAAEKQAETIFQLGAGLSLFVACLGLFGLASFTLQQRIKELGIRKVLGATHWNIFYLLSSSFLGPIILSFFLAVPLAFWLMNDWLNNFAYRLNLSVWHFGTAGMAALLVALISVSYLSIKAAGANPVSSLRHE